MSTYFTIIYVKTNRFSNEQIAIGLLANINDLPEFHFSDAKLNFALKNFNSNLTRAIKKSLNLLASDVNKFVNGELSIPMFEGPYEKKILEKLTMKKRGLLYYGDLQYLTGEVSYSVLFEKYIAKEWKSVNVNKTNNNQTFKKRFNLYVSQKRFNSFSKKIWLTDDEYPLLSVPVQVDLIRQKNGFTVFKAIDFRHSESTILQHIATFRLLIESLTAYSNSNGLSKGRYYLVYESPKETSKIKLLSKMKSVYKRFEMIKISEMADKI